MAPSRNLTVQIVGDTRGFDRAMVRASASTSRFGSSIKAAQLAIGGAAAAGVSLAVSFDRSMRNVNSIAQLPEKRFKSLEKQVLSLAGKTAQAPKTLADGLYDLVSSGFNAHQSMVILAKSAKAATAGLTDTATSTHAVAAVLNAYHQKAKDAGKVSDTLFQTVNRGVITFEELAQNIGDVLPFASSLGVNLQQLGASISTMTKEGISAPETMTRIKNVMVTLLKPGDALKKAFKDLGVASGEALIHQKGFQGALEAIIGTTDGSKKAVAQLFPNIRALGGALALTGNNAKSANKDVKAFGDVSGATNKALSQQAKSVSYQWQKMTAQVKALAIGYASRLLPAISKVIGILSNPHMSAQQKFDRLRGQLLRTFDQLAPKITDAIDKATPAIIAAVASSAPKAASHFATAFVNAGAWSKLLIGGWLLKRMGGIPAFEAVGAQAGTAMARGAATGGALGVAAGRGGGVGGGAAAGAGVLAGAAAKAKGLLKTGGKLAGRFAALDLAINLVDSKGHPIAAVANTLHDLTFGITPKVNVKTGQEQQADQFKKLSASLDAAVKQRDTSGLDKLIGKFHSMAAEARAFHAPKVAGAYDQLANQAGRSLDRIIQQTQNVRSANKQFAANIRGLQLDGSKDFGKLVDAVVFGSRSILKIGGGNTKLTQQAISHQFGLARQRVQQAMDKQVLSVKQGTALLHQLAVKELGLYGIKGGKVNVVLAKGANGQLRPNQRGGHINEGTASGDSVPALLERDEYVLNRNAVKKVGKRALDRLNFGTAARFQKGGSVGGLKPGIAAAVRATLSANPGLVVTSTTGGKHADGSYHYLGEAADIAGSPSVMLRAAAWVKQHLGRGLAEGIHNPNLSIKFGKNVPPSFWGASTWAGHANHIHLAVIGALNALGFGDATLKRPVIQGLGGVPGAAAQGAMDRVYQAANAAVQAAISGTGGPGVESGSGLTSAGGAFNKGALRNLWTAHGGPANLANMAAAIALAESGGDPHAHNPSGASGLWQILGQLVPGNIFDPDVNAANAVAKWRTAPHGGHNFSPWVTYTDGAYRKYLQRGGLVGLAKGGSVASMGLSPDATAGRGHPAISIANALATVGSRAKKKARGRALSGLVGKLNRLGVLPKNLSGKLSKLAGLDAIYGDRADRAGQLADAGLPGNVLGKSQAQWLTLELENLLKWRNTITDALGVIARRRRQVAVLTEQARKRLAGLKKQLDAKTGTRATLTARLKAAEKALKTLQKHPKGKSKQIRAASHLIHVIGQQIKAFDKGKQPLVREEGALTGKILPALKTQWGNLGQARGDLSSSLTDIQGPGGPMTRLRALPALGALGGSIFDVQMQLRQLAQPATATDNTTSDTSGTGPSAALLQQLLTQANLRTAVSEAQFKVLQGMPPYGGSYDTGGVVPGPQGAARTAVVHGGEGVFTPAQMQAMGGSQPTTIQVVVMDGAVDPNKIRVIANQEANVVVKQQSRRGGRNLPGRAGALH